jgi:hypothetical protein
VSEHQNSFSRLVVVLLKQKPKTKTEKLSLFWQKVLKTFVLKCLLWKCTLQYI